MWYAIAFGLGLLISSIGILPPGIINMTAVKIKLEVGKSKAIYFIIGALLIVLVQTLIALYFAKYLNSNNQIIRRFQQVGVLVFASISIYLFFGTQSKKVIKEVAVQSNKSYLYKGILVSAINMFPIPYYVFSSITLSANQLFVYEDYYIFWFTIGVLIGTYLIFYLYISVFKQKENGPGFFQRNGNKIIGTVTGVIALLTLYKLIQ